MNPLLADLKASVEAIADPEDREAGRAMAILVSSLEVGAAVKRLRQRTGFPKEIIQNIADHMIEAGLWIGGIVDDSEWWDEHGELDGVALFLLDRKQRFMDCSTCSFLEVDAGNKQ